MTRYEFMQKKIGDILNQEVKYLYRPTNRWRKGTIEKITTDRIVVKQKSTCVLTTIFLADIHWDLSKEIWWINLLQNLSYMDKLS